MADKTKTYSPASINWHRGKYRRGMLRLSNLTIAPKLIELIELMKPIEPLN